MEKYTLNIKDSVTLTIEQEKEDDSMVIVTFEGQLDTYNCVKCQQELQKLVEVNEFKKMVVNCEKLTYLSSMGVGLFAATQKMLNTRNGKIYFYRSNEKVIEVFKQLGFLKFFKIVIFYLFCSAKCKLCRDNLSWECQCWLLNLKREDDFFLLVWTYYNHYHCRCSLNIN